MIEEKRGGRKLLAHLGASIKKPIYFSCLSDRKGEKELSGKENTNGYGGGDNNFLDSYFLLLCDWK